MRKNGETLDEGRRERLWRVYTSRLLMGNWRMERQRFFASVRDADGPATFRWLFPQDQVRDHQRDQWRFFLASLEQAAGERDAALNRYEDLRADLQRERSSGPMLDATIEAIMQLRSP